MTSRDLWSCRLSCCPLVEFVTIEQRRSSEWHYSCSWLDLLWRAAATIRFRKHSRYERRQLTINCSDRTLVKAMYKSCVEFISAQKKESLTFSAFPFCLFYSPWSAWPKGNRYFTCLQRSHFMGFFRYMFRVCSSWHFNYFFFLSWWIISNNTQM